MPKDQIFFEHIMNPTGKKKKTICLNMIVKNEAHIIADTLEHLDKFIKFDYWVISDTGSTDGTQEIIKKFYKKKGIPGNLVEHAWKDFGFNRSAACAAAYNKTDYIFVWDADDEIAGNFVMPTELTADSYKFIFGNDSGFRYSRGQLFNNHKRWIYKGVLHEYADCLDPTGPMESVLGDYYFISGRRGARSKDPNKYLNDALVLEKGFNEAFEQKDHIYNRYAFYCAQSYNSCNMYEKSIEWYKKSLTLNLWIQERYICCLEIYDMYDKLKRPNEGLVYLVESYKYDSTRVECVYRLIKHYCIHGPPEVAYMYYTLIQDFYENKYLTGEGNISDKLFAKKDEHDFYLPYYMVITCERTNHLDVCGKMYDMIFRQQHVHIDSWWIRNLVHNMQFCVKNLPNTMDFLQNMLVYFDKLFKRGVTLEPPHYDILGKVIDMYRSLLTAANPSALTIAKANSESKINVLLTITSCKRFDLFEKTVNSILNTWSDIDKVDYFFCVDDNSTQRDRTKMAKAYPFFKFYMKTSKEKGHRKSMNVIYDKLVELKPKYWIHLEDDWLFFQKDSYVEKSIQFLEKYKSQNIHQILFNRNYGELFEGWTTNGGAALEPGFTVHVKSDTIPGRNCGYWPHYSFRPSMIRTETILELGNYDSANTFFERDYADKYFAKGYKSGFYDTICSLHIGKLTSDKTGTNAYTLNNAGQFGELSNVKKPSTFIVNLIRRTDRKEAMEDLFDKEEIKGYEFYEAVDGKELTLTEEITKMFLGNDFGSRKGFIGCALSHYDLWKQLLADSTNEYYTIFEDDIQFCTGFKEKYESALKSLENKDMLFLGYTQYNKDMRFAASVKPVIALDIGKYLGGFFGYVITKAGAKKLVAYIEENGIKHGIDYLIKLIPGFTAVNTQPHIVHTEWVSSFASTVDTDIQKDYSSLPIVPKVNKDDWIFYEGMDSGDGDLQSLAGKSVDELFGIASGNSKCVAFNTLGFLKSKVTMPLIQSPWLSAPHGLYIKKSYTPIQKCDVNKTRVKMLCNWCSSEDLCKEWLKLTKGNYIWNDLQITWEDTNIDYYVIINKPRPGDVFVRERTIVFHMEPWCGESWQTWGVKTWGEWATPDPKKFLQVRSHDKYFNTGFWQLSLTYTDLKEKPAVKSSNLGNIVSSICSSKYFDPGHKKRIDFMKFIESKSDASVKLHIYNEDNQHGFASYVGKAKPFVDKEKGIMPYKYYFMCENNVEKNFITEKLWEPILCETLCFYWGCPNVSDYLDPLAYVQLDMNDFEGSFQIMKNAIETNLWEQRLPAIKKAKEQVLEYYGFFPTLERVIKGNDTLDNTSILKNTDVNNVSKTVCFIHSCTLSSSGTEKLDLLVQSMKASGLLNELDLVIINNIGIQLNKDLYTAIDPRIKIIQHSTNTNLFEIPTLKLIQGYSQVNPNDKILYLHTKGISYSKADHKYKTGIDWINYMLYFLTGPSNYRKCLRLLDTYDTVGCNYDTRKPHYSGNFWWANASYLKTVPVESLKDKMSAEWWLLSRKPPANHHVLYSTGKNHFNEFCKLNEYCSKSLVVYTYFSSPSSDYNLSFFCKHALVETVEVDYIIVINGNTCKVDLPSLPNLKVLYRENQGFDFGGHKAALDLINGKSYAYYCFMNSGMIGPFLSEENNGHHWIHHFTKKLTEKVKLVGTSIFCESELKDGAGPRVESFCFTTDHVGLDLLLKEGTIFNDTYTEKFDVIKNCELGMSQCILKNGFTVDCMLDKYSELDWSNKANWTINNNQYPSRKNSYFGESIDPFEVIFHKWFWQNPVDSDVSIDIVHTYVKKMNEAHFIDAYKGAEYDVMGWLVNMEMGPNIEFDLFLKSLTSMRGRSFSYMKYAGVPIVFQTEQMSYNNGDHRNADSFVASLPTMKKVLILDYSLTNIKLIKEAVNSNPAYIYSNFIYVHTPLLYNPSMLKLFTMYDKKENDVACLFGCPSERRMEIVNQLKEKGIKVFCISNWNIQGKIYEISKCRLLLNIHYSDKHTVFEYARCSLPIFLGIPVLSEASDIEDDLENPLVNEVISKVKFTPYDSLVSKAIEMLSSPDLGKHSTDRFKELSDIQYQSINTQINKQMDIIEKGDKHVCFIHSCHVEMSGTEALDHLLDSLKVSGLLETLDSVILHNCGLPLNQQKYYSLHSKIRAINFSRDTSGYECPTLKLIHSYSQQNPNVKVLYLHTKGISYRKEDFAYSKNLEWVNYMLYFLVNRHVTTLRVLDTYDTAGCDYSTLGDHPHYAGNFWWANTNYIKTLSVDDNLKEKHDAEWWLLSAAPKKYILHTSNYDWYSSDEYTIQKYIQDTSNTGLTQYDIDQLNDTVLNRRLGLVSLIDNEKGGGLCNQIMALLGGTMLAIEQGKSIVVVDDFNPQIGKTTVLPVDSVFNFNEMNQLLSEHKVRLIHKRDLTFSIKMIEYGTEETRMNLTREILNSFVYTTVLYIPRLTDLNKIKGDPAPGKEKKLYIQYSIAGQVFKDSFHELGGLQADVCINISKLPFVYTWKWINPSTKDSFSIFTKYIRFTPVYTKMVDTFFSKSQISSGKFNVLHLRNESDAIEHWSRQNCMNKEEFKKVLEFKYISLIETHIPKDEPLVVLTYDVESPVIKFLHTNSYTYFLTKKGLEGREQNAILDLLIGSKANGVFIGNFNPVHLRGSSFSYTILQLLDSRCKKVVIDLDSIRKDAIVC